MTDVDLTKLSRFERRQLCQTVELQPGTVIQSWWFEEDRSDVFLIVSCEPFFAIQVQFSSYNMPDENIRKIRIRTQSGLFNEPDHYFYNSIENLECARNELAYMVMWADRAVIFSN